MHFFSKTIGERTAPGTRNAVSEQAYVFFCHAREDGYTGIVIADSEYDKRVAFSVITKSLEQFTAKYTKETVDRATARDLPFPEIETMLTKYQNPAEADALLRVQRDLDETKIVLHKTIESVIGRGEKIDNLVERSNDLSASSKVFFGQAKKANSQCCIVM
ncbi:SNARE Ykt6, variant [Capsaspora owczarzaki ATCC 30864]|nr:SNARE Ykt6, variant [Capsaspora owczarzaki ATCC 30864]